MLKYLLTILPIIGILSSASGLAQEIAAIRPGVQAPRLEVSRWISTGGDQSNVPTGIVNGKVNVIEFWSTTCTEADPSFLHLVALQHTFREQDVRFTFVSHEPPATISTFLRETVKTPDQQTISYGRLAHKLVIGSAQNSSPQRAYLGKKFDNHLPWAFIVGREGKVEWDGHPSELDTILEAVVLGRWDREKMEREQRLVEEVQASIARLTKAKNWDGAINEIDRFLAMSDEPRITYGLLKSKLEIFSRSGKHATEFAVVVQQLFAICEEEPLFVHDVSATVYQLALRGHIKDGKVILLACDALERAILLVQDGSTESGLLHTLAKLEGLMGKTEQAIVHQTRAIELAGEAQKPTMIAFLIELKRLPAVQR
ncbi:hypothetical protein SH449x_000844 [Pirellulaceae bacterium SH449]